MWKSCAAHDDGARVFSHFNPQQATMAEEMESHPRCLAEGRRLTLTTSTCLCGSLSGLGRMCGQRTVLVMATDSYLCLLMEMSVSISLVEFYQWFWVQLCCLGILRLRSSSSMLCAGNGYAELKGWCNLTQIKTEAWHWMCWSTKPEEQKSPQPIWKNQDAFIHVV